MQDATVQSTPQTSQAQAAVAPSSYVAPAPQQQAPQAPVQYQVGTSYPQAVPQVAPQGVTSYQSNPSQYAPQSQPAAPQSNPWETAFNKVVNLLGSPVPSPFQGQQSQQINPTQYTPANYGQPNVQATPQSAPQTWSTNQTSSSNSSQTYSVSSLADVAEVLQWSPESRMVVEAYGTEAPAILNQYALNLENVLDSAVAWGHKAQDLLGGYANFAVNEHQENLAYNEILTNPDVLSDYTLQFFGPEGPYPVYENEAQLETPGYQTQAVTPGMGQFPAPPAAAAPQQPQNFWESFKATMDRDPQNAWRVINQATPDVMANKLFVME
jgi:hypothetical protein